MPDPYNDLENLARFDYDLFCRKQGSQKDVAFQYLSEKRKRFYIELNHLIPVGLRKMGYEIIRPEEIAEINEKLIIKLARAIHSRYLHQVRKQVPGPEGNIYLSWIHKREELNIFSVMILMICLKRSSIPTWIMHIIFQQSYYLSVQDQAGQERIQTIGTSS